MDTFSGRNQLSRDHPLGFFMTLASSKATSS